MFSETHFMKDLHIMEKALQVESLRRKVIADNIANANVPHFKRSEVNFESELSRVLAEQNEKKIPSYTTHAKHISFNEQSDSLSVKPRVHLDYLTGYRNDGNNVDPDKELTLAAKNRMRYELFVQYVDGYFKKMNGLLRPAG